MFLKKYILPALAALFLSSALSSCLGNDEDTIDYNAWRQLNEKYLADAEAERNDDGTPVYERISPSWATGVYVLAKWHNDRSLTAGSLVPLDNSTVDVIYECKYADGTVLDSSYKQTQYGDSIYRCMPNANIVGFWTMLTRMHVGDSVTCIIPMNAAYGTVSTSVLPYSTLIYNMKLKRIHAYEVNTK